MTGVKFILGKNKVPPSPHSPGRVSQGALPLQSHFSHLAPTSISAHYDAATWVRGSSRYCTKAWACERGRSQCHTRPGPA